MNSFINIQPKTVSVEGNKIKISVLHVELNKRALIKVELYSEDEKIIDTNHILLENEEYLLWQHDDYLLNYVCEKYGYILSETSNDILSETSNYILSETSN